jgi:hypothetical protein
MEGVAECRRLPFLQCPRALTALRIRAINGSSIMADGLMLVCGVGFFVVAVVYTLACEKM